ncbi:hypothetical protein QA597_08075 [Marinilabiliaceae bacterium ANBcel2]|nr:hypothetical protein [Marinilabiliaceae bacterium ANBcel2]
MKSFLFIIPLTPKKIRVGQREVLWSLCKKTLLSQTYENWKAIIIGEDRNFQPQNNNHFHLIPYEGRKEEKLQKATEYIIQNNIPGDYIIRLDDDDIINPTILKKVANLDFDLYVDKYQWFWYYESGMVSNRVWHWFPNTCIHKREHALAEWGDYAKGDFKRFKEQALLIENDHSQLHPYYKNKKVVFADKNHPVYLRTITFTSITAKNSKDHEKYLKRFGLWEKNNIQDFQFLKEHINPNYKSLPHYSLKEKVLLRYYNLRSYFSYSKQIFQ